jgi:predicted transcriptional regulator
MMIGLFSGFCALVLAYYVARRVVRTKPQLHCAKTRIGEAMQRKIHAVRPEDSLGEAARWLVETGQHPLPIIDRGGVTVGVLTRCDVATGINYAGADAAVTQAPHHGAITVGPDDPVDGLVDQLAHQPDAIAVVMSNGAAVGVVTPEQLTTFVALHGR